MRNQAEVLLKVGISHDADASLKRQLYCGIRAALVDGSVPSGMRLPSTRRFAQTLGISRTTVVDVFEQLLADGLTVGRPGAGTFVAEHVKSLSQPMKAVRAAIGALSDRASSVAGASREVEIAESLGPTAFGLGSGGGQIFPLNGWLRLLSQSARTSMRGRGDSDEGGYLPLRRALMHRLLVTRGIRCSVEQVFIFAGVRQALDVAAQVLAQRGDVVVLDEPGNPQLGAAFSATGAEIVRANLRNDESWTFSADAERARVLCLSPTHHYPSGAMMSLSQRVAVLDEAARRKAWVIEEEVDAEVQYVPDSSEPLFRLDTDDRVLHIASFSQTLFPVMELATVVVPAGLVEAFRAFTRVGGYNGANVSHSAATAFIDDGQFVKHATRLREVYLERRETLLEVAERRLQGAMRIATAANGIYLYGQLPPSLNAMNVARVARTQGVEVRAVSPLSDRNVTWNGLLLGFAEVTPAQIRKGAVLLDGCLTKCR